MLVIGPHRQTLICVWAVGGGVLDAPCNLAPPLNCKGEHGSPLCFFCITIPK